MAHKPFKMKGSPFKRNFGIGDSESPDTPSPLNAGWLGKAMSAGMATLPGGFDANAPKKEEDGTQFERGEDGKLVLDNEGKPIKIEDPAEVKSKGANIVESLVKGLFKKKPKKLEEDEDEE